MAESPDYDPSTYERSADVYDVMNAARGKSYADEAATLLRLTRQHVADAPSLLDVACGTGLHLSHLRRDLRVEGVEPHPGLRAIARDRLDGVPVHDGDMRTFDLGRGFDVVTCLFSAIGYMLTLDDLRTAIGQMAAHVSPAVSSSWSRGSIPRRGSTAWSWQSRRPPRTWRSSACRTPGAMAHISHFDFYWTVGRGPTLHGRSEAGAATRPSGGRRPVDHWIEPHRLALWSDDQYRDAFARAGLDVEHDREGLIGRGLYLGHKPRR